MKSLNAVLFLLFLFPTVAESAVGSITEITGSGIIERGSSKNTGEVGFPIEMNDIAATANGRMSIQFEDNTRVDVTEQSRLFIDEFVYDPATNEGGLSIKATLGTIQYASGQIAKQNQQNVEIQTPSATIGVRGTDFIMIVDEIGRSSITLLPSCIDDWASKSTRCYVGEISVGTGAGFVVLNKAFQTTVTDTGNRAPTKPVILEVDETEIGNMLIVSRGTEYDIALDKSSLQDRANKLDVDFLEYDELDRDYLAESLEGIWTSGLDKTENLLEIKLSDVMDELLAQINSELTDVLTQNTKSLFDNPPNGLDPETGIFYQDNAPKHFISRDDGAGNRFELTLDQDYGYNIDMQQGSFSFYGFGLGDRTNRIYINQSN